MQNVVDDNFLIHTLDTTGSTKMTASEEGPKFDFWHFRIVRVLMRHSNLISICYQYSISIYN